MPCIENWTSKPLHIINNLFGNRKDEQGWQKDVENYFMTKVSSTSGLELVPSLNDVPLHELKSDSLVRFRCMIQDTFEPEYFMDIYEIQSSEGGQKSVHSSKYKDIIECPEGFEVKESSVNKTGCRQVLYCVSIPAESPWVKEKNCIMRSGVQQSGRAATGASSTSLKRTLDDDDDMEQDEVMENEATSLKRPRATISNGSDNKTNHIPLKKNHPLPNESGPVCIVKVYDEDIAFKVNDVYEFIGVLSVSPLLSSTFDQAADGESSGFAAGTEHMEEDKAHHPPPSFVPRLHCVNMRNLTHNNPLLPFNQTSFSDFSNMAMVLRDDLISFLKQATFGDDIAAEYILLHLVARVYSRTGTMAVGKLALNISNIPPNTDYPRLLSELIRKLVTKAHYLPLILENMNKLNFIPKKNYSTNRLDSGILQLSDGTHLIVDETALKPGRLEQKGVRNIQALSTLLNFQKVDYDFQFHPVVFYHDISALVLSEGKSMLHCDCQVPLKPQIAVPKNLEEYFNTLTSSIEIMDKFRVYLTCARLADYELEETMMKRIEDDFVAARQITQDQMTAEDLHLQLVLARLRSITFGKDKLVPAVWQKVGSLEEERKERLK